MQHKTMLHSHCYKCSLHFFIQKKNNFILQKKENYADYEKYFFWIFRIKIYMEKIIFLKKNPQK